MVTKKDAIFSCKGISPALALLIEFSPVFRAVRFILKFPFSRQLMQANLVSLNKQRLKHGVVYKKLAFCRIVRKTSHQIKNIIQIAVRILRIQIKN